jgi:hypothetical protein
MENLSEASIRPVAKAGPLGRLVHILSSYGLACLVLFFMTIATWVGTIAQQDIGLYSAQKKYFESWFFSHEFHIGSSMVLPVWLPGGMLLMALLGINLLLGGLIRLKRKPQNIGLFITHSSILVLLAAGLVEYLYKIDGNLAVVEGSTTDIMQSFHHRVIEIEPLAASGTRLATVIHDRDFQTATPTRPAKFTLADFPFTVNVTRYVRNAEPIEAARETPAASQPATVVDGFWLRSLEPSNDNERNIEGAEVLVTPKNGDDPIPALLWGGTNNNAIVTVDGKEYALRIGRQKWRLPFSITLNEFIREVYPGTDKPRRFSSLVTVNYPERKEDVEVTMNLPLRSDGFAVFQSSFDMQQAGDKVIKTSVFQIARNPSDHWPLFGFSLVFIGLLLHFSMKLFRFLSPSRKAILPATVPATSQP